MICSRKATSDNSRLFLAIRIKRVFEAKPRPCSKCWDSLNWKLELSAGLTLWKALLLVTRLLLKPTDTLVPHWNPCKYSKFAVVVPWYVPANGLVGMKLA